MNDIATKTANLAERNPLDRTSTRYSGVNYGGICRSSKSLMIEFLKATFENLPENHTFKFDEEQKHSKIFIADRLTYNLEEVDKRPAIVVHRQGIQYSKIARDGRVNQQLLQKRDDDSGLHEGLIQKTGLYKGTLQIQCYGKGQTLQAELLGDSVFELITDMEDALREIGFFECYANAIGEETIVSEGAKIRYIMVPINVVFSMQRTWSITPQNLRVLRNIVMTKMSANAVDMV